MRRIVWVGSLVTLALSLANADVVRASAPSGVGRAISARAQEKQARPSRRVKRPARHLTAVPTVINPAGAEPNPHLAPPSTSEHVVLGAVLGEVERALRSRALSSEWRGALTVARVALRKYGVTPPHE